MEIREDEAGDKVKSKITDLRCEENYCKDFRPTIHRTNSTAEQSDGWSRLQEADLIDLDRKYRLSFDYITPRTDYSEVISYVSPLYKGYFRSEFLWRLPNQ